MAEEGEEGGDDELPCVDHIPLNDGDTGKKQDNFRQSLELRVGPSGAVPP